MTSNPIDPPRPRTTMPLLIRWGQPSLALAMVVLNGWWLWGDWSPPRAKAIDGLIARGQLAEAERALETRLRWSPGDGDSRMNLARLLLKRGDHLGGARQLHLVPPWWLAKVEASFLEAQAFKQVNRARDTEAALLACISDDPLHPTPSSLFHGAAKELVAFYVLEGRLDEARRVLWRAYDESIPLEKPGVLATRIRAELERIDHVEAVAKLRTYVEADPEDEEARRALALEEHATGDEAAADRDIETCLRLKPDDPLAWRARLEILNDRGDVDAARAVIGRLPKSVDSDPKIWLYRGLDLQRSGDRNGALDAFRRSVALAPDDPEALYKLGMAEQFLGDADSARDHIARSRQLHSAYARLSETYHDFLDQLRRPRPDPSAYRTSVEQLAETCRILGMTREADALRQLPAPG